MWLFVSLSDVAVPPSSLEGAHFCLKLFKCFRINTSVLLAHCFFSWLGVNFSPSALSLSLFSFFYYCSCKGGGHRKITIIIEDPVAGWQCSSAVLHHLTPPNPPFFPPAC